MLVHTLQRDEHSPHFKILSLSSKRKRHLTFNDDEGAQSEKKIQTTTTTTTTDDPKVSEAMNQAVITVMSTIGFNNKAPKVDAPTLIVPETAALPPAPPKSDTKAEEVVVQVVKAANDMEMQQVKEKVEDKKNNAEKDPQRQQPQHRQRPAGDRQARKNQQRSGRDKRAEERRKRDKEAEKHIQEGVPDWSSIAKEKAIKNEFDPRTGKWKTTEIWVKIAEKPFAKGAMRFCFHMQILPQHSESAQNLHSSAPPSLSPVSSSLLQPIRSPNIRDSSSKLMTSRVISTSSGNVSNGLLPPPSAASRHPEPYNQSKKYPAPYVKPGANNDQKVGSGSALPPLMPSASLSFSKSDTQNTASTSTLTTATTSTTSTTASSMTAGSVSRGERRFVAKMSIKYYLQRIETAAAQQKEKERSFKWFGTDSNAAANTNLLKDREDSFQDVQLQMFAKQWARLFNNSNPPKKVDFVPAFCLDLIQRPGCPTCCVEPYIEGTYKKHNNNYGFVSEDHRNTPQAFSHFTYHVSNHTVLICDIQGVGDMYTDPLMHSTFNREFGRGNLGRQGMERFLVTHKCNPICNFLDLPSVNECEYNECGTVPQILASPFPPHPLAGSGNTEMRTSGGRLRERYEVDGQYEMSENSFTHDDDSDVADEDVTGHAIVTNTKNYTKSPFPPLPVKEDCGCIIS